MCGPTCGSHRRLAASTAADPSGVASSVYEWIRYSIPLVAVWLIYWLAFLPGLISADSVNQWGQIVSGRYDDWHPVSHTWVLWLLSRPGHSLGAVSFVQVILAALLFGLVLAAVRRLGTPGWLVWAVMAWLALSPVYGVGVIALWKDNAFGLTVLWTALLLLQAVARGRITGGWSVALGIALALLSLFRHNGHLIAIPTLGVAAWYFWSGGRAMMLRAAAIGVLLVMLVIGVTRAAHVPHAPAVLKQQMVIHQIAALVAAGTPLSAHSREVLERLAPLSTWASAYRCEAIGEILYWPGLREHLDLDREQLVPVWAALAARNPWALARHWACVTRYIWSPRSELIVGPLLSHGEFVAANTSGLATASRLPWVQERIARLVAATLHPQSVARFLVWQPAFPLYVLLGSLGLALQRTRSAAPLVILAPALFNTLIWLAVASGPHFRFQWPVFLLAPVGLCLGGGRVSASADSARNGGHVAPAQHGDGVQKRREGLRLPQGQPGAH
jgi:hypothetical protein